MNDYYTSIQYQLTNNKIFDDVFAHADEFSKILFAGPESLKKYLVEQWESIRTDFKNKNFQNVVDIDRPVTESDFVVTGYKISEDIRSYIMAFPVSSRPDASCEVIALTVVKGRPRYFTIEASEHAMNQARCYVIGEWYVDENGRKAHRNYGTVEKINMEEFMRFIEKQVETQA